MSEFINNREKRQEKLKMLIKKLHDGASVEDVKSEFDTLTTGISAVEITEMEQALVNEGMPVEEIQRLCDVHAAVFKGSIEDIHKEDSISFEGFDEGHPVHTFKKENRKIESVLEEVLNYLSEYTADPTQVKLDKLKFSLIKLSTIDFHYKRKENLLFPYMEKYNITAPPQVMWGVDDEIRADLKKAIELVSLEMKEIPKINEVTRKAVASIGEMIFKEEEIMFPMVLEKFSQSEWIEIEKASAEIGYTLLPVVKRWLPKVTNIETHSKEVVVNTVVTSTDVTNTDEDIVINRIKKDSQTLIPFDAGSLTSMEVNAILNTIPFDMTFVDANDRVKYFTQGKERVFDRPITIIGREVKHCHPPKSVHIVEKIVEDLKSGKKEHEDFWIKMGEQFVYIRYFAVRNKSGEFLGTLEITQNIKPIIELEGEKRLMSN
ncbi:DUF438 domain-containing protein [Fusibacter bizertensis]